MKNIQIDEGIVASQIITTLLENDAELNEALVLTKNTVNVGALQNCREQGYTYFVYNFKNSKSFTWCTYEHRNSDSIIINGKEGYHCGSGDLPYAGDSKWNPIASSGYREFDKAAKRLASEIIHFVKQE